MGSEYKRISVSGKIVYEHRAVMEAHLGRPLARHEVVHHRNHDRLDNRLENLSLTTQGEHIRAHMLETPEVYSHGGKPHQLAKRDCAWCGTSFQPRIDTNLCCSVSCAQRRRYSR